MRREQLVRDLLGHLRIGAIAELLLHHADDLAGHLRILGGEGGNVLRHDLAQLGLRETLRQERRAPGDLEVELGDLLLAALARVDVVGARLLHRLLVGRDHVEDQRVVNLTGEALGGAALHDLGVDHADEVRGLRVLCLHRSGELLAELAFEVGRHGDGLPRYQASSDGIGGTWTTAELCAGSFCSSISRAPSMRRCVVETATRSAPSTRHAVNSNSPAPQVSR
ncbi:hypothetical protein BH11MYX3_BH11MYX3_36550 [soil metagenome]